MAKKPKSEGKKLEQRDAFIALGVAAAVTLVLHIANGPVQWWVYLVAFLIVAVGVFQGQQKIRAERNQAYGKDA